MIPGRPLSRRTALVTTFGTAGLAALTGAGCSIRVPGRASPTPAATPVPGPVDPDDQIVADLVRGLRQSLALLQDTRTRHPGLAPQLASLLTAERAHLAVLLQAAPEDGPTGPQPATIAVPARAPKALSTVLERTRVLRAQCYACAGRAESGQFARLLAAMGAALSQRLVLVQAAGAAKAGR